MFGVVVRRATGALCITDWYIHTAAQTHLVRVMHVMRTSVTHRAPHIDERADMGPLRKKTKL